MAEEPKTVVYEIADKTGKAIVTGEAASKEVVIPNLTPNTDYAKGDFKGRKIDSTGEWKPSDYIDVPAFKTKPIIVTGISLDNTTLSLETGKTGTLKATVSPANATNNVVKWASAKQSVATVDGNGKVTAVGAGDANITATTDDQGKVATCRVTVTDPVVAVTGVTLDKTTAEVEEGSTIQLTATVAPSNATNKAITWKSADETIATVDNTGKVTAIKAGTVNVTATTTDGNKTAQCAVTVTAKAEEPPAGE
ncbi:hypothetical protein LFYK43_14380 [Ligilactobacillus salitolerans]|uniref:BIG2 domain-containing protein n=1 Tax=Ligilactobacillus salitolerans TaxID=1808352 RepID=A0A401ITX4_9LACO|nr:Ig-like domain-containing protein [Ligilactobacillus salitolerans]GBG94979.1 hypothetical protein LFYK43_14380 [Ligilactobacillus salitolerans]